MNLGTVLRIFASNVLKSCRVNTEVPGGFSQETSLDNNRCYDKSLPGNVWRSLYTNFVN